MNVLHIHIFIRHIFELGCLRCDLLDDTGPSALVSGSGIGRVLGTCTVCTVHMPACTVHSHYGWRNNEYIYLRRRWAGLPADICKG